MLQVESTTTMAQLACMHMQDWKDPSEFHGCGSFAKESWMIFCRGHRGMSAVQDVKLRAYLRWLASGKIQTEAAAKRRAAGSRKRKREWRTYLAAGYCAQGMQCISGPSAASV